MAHDTRQPSLLLID